MKWMEERYYLPQSIEQGHTENKNIEISFTVRTPIYQNFCSQRANTVPLVFAAAAGTKRSARNIAGADANTSAWAPSRSSKS